MREPRVSPCSRVSPPRMTGSKSPCRSVASSVFPPISSPALPQTTQGAAGSSFVRGRVRIVALVSAETFCSQASSPHHAPRQKPPSETMPAAIARAGQLNRILAHHICDWLVPTTDFLLDRVHEQGVGVHHAHDVGCGRHPQVRGCVAAGQSMAADCGRGQPEPAAGAALPGTETITGAWWPAKETYPGELLQISLNDATPVNEHMTLVAGIGIEMGQLTIDGVVEPVKFGGSGKVIGVG